jgi:hypothetical protein
VKARQRFARRREGRAAALGAQRLARCPARELGDMAMKGSCTCSTSASMRTPV